MSADSLLYVFEQNIGYWYLIYDVFIYPLQTSHFSVYTELLKPVCENELKSDYHMIDFFFLLPWFPKE